MDYIRYANQGATRRLPLSEDLVSALSFLPELGVQAEVFSGGQPVAGQGPRVGSTRHDLGGAADVFFYKDGRRLDWANPDDLPIFQEIVSRGKQQGLTGFGAGPGYMQPGSMHIGFGNPAVWGAEGKGANAPDWLRQAYYGAGAPTGGNMAPQTGLLGNATISTQGQMPQQEPEQLPFFQRPGVANFFDTLAMGLEGMTLNPNEGLMRAAQASMQQRREAAQTAQQRNRTVEALKQMGADPQLIQLAQSGYGEAALKEALRLRQGPQYRTITGQEAAAFGLDPSKAYNVGADGKITAIGGGGVTNVIGGERETSFEKEIGKSIAGMATELVQQGAQASSTLSQLGALEQALKDAPQGARGAITIAAGNLGIPMEGLSEAQAAQAIINRLVPQQRPAGSGPMSDADLELFKQSLPRIINQPGGNQRILDTMRGIAEYDRKRGEIAARLMNNEIEQGQALRELNELTNPLDWVRSSRGQGAQPSATGEAVEMDGYTIREVK